MDKLKNKFYDINKLNELDNTCIDIVDKKQDRDGILLEVLIEEIKKLKEYFKDPILKEDRNIKNISVGANMVLDQLMNIVRLR